jgi:hypothetical protein
MVRLTLEGDAVVYTTKRRGEMSENLYRMADKLDKSSLRYKNMVGTLERLFHTSSMAMGIEPYSFLDLGYVYRRGGAGEMLVAAPLCYPATLALLDLWGIVSPVSGARLVEAGKDGTMFEDLVWDVLLARGYSDGGVKILCNPLGEAPTTEVLMLQLNEYFISTLESPNTDAKWAALKKELAKMQTRCNELTQSLLYRCPKGCVDVDFFVLRHDGTCIAIQTSISSLTDHSSASTLVGIPQRFGFPIERYVYVTVKPEKHVGLARNSALANVRIVSADKWIGV